MSELSVEDYRCLLDAIRIVHEQTDLERLPQVMLDVVEKLIPCEHLTFNELHPAQRRAASFFNTPELTAAASSYMPVFERYMPQHPVLKHYREGQLTGEKPDVRKISDFLPAKAWQRAPLYAECLRHLDTEFQIILPIEMGQDVAVGIAICRKTTDFSERDRQLLQELMPHMTSAYRDNLQRLRIRRLFDPRSDIQSIAALLKLGLTTRQAQVLCCLIQGKTTAEIAAALSCSPRTVHKHMEQLFARLRVQTRSGAVATVIERLESIT